MMAANHHTKPASEKAAKAMANMANFADHVPGFGKLDGRPMLLMIICYHDFGIIAEALFAFLD